MKRTVRCKHSDPLCDACMRDERQTKRGEDTIKQEVNQYVFDIRKQVSRKAYWNATKLAHELYEFLNKQPYVEENNPNPTKSKQGKI